jgi:hypothetical protein
VPLQTKAIEATWARAPVRSFALRLQPAIDQPPDGLRAAGQIGLFSAPVIQTFTVSDPNAPGGPARAVVAKLIVPAELMADLAQMIAADRPEPGAAFAGLPIDAVAH